MFLPGLILRPGSSRDQYNKFKNEEISNKLNWFNDSPKHVHHNLYCFMKWRSSQQKWSKILVYLAPWRVNENVPVVPSLVMLVRHRPCWNYLWTLTRRVRFWTKCEVLWHHERTGFSQSLKKISAIGGT